MSSDIMPAAARWLFGIIGRPLDATEPGRMLLAKARAFWPRACAGTEDAIASMPGPMTFWPRTPPPAPSTEPPIAPPLVPRFTELKQEIRHVGKGVENIEKNRHEKPLKDHFDDVQTVYGGVVRVVEVVEVVGLHQDVYFVFVRDDDLHAVGYGVAKGIEVALDAERVRQ